MHKGEEHPLKGKRKEDPKHEVVVLDRWLWWQVKFHGNVPVMMFSYGNGVTSGYGGGCSGFRGYGCVGSCYSGGNGDPDGVLWRV